LPPREPHGDSEGAGLFLGREEDGNNDPAVSLAVLFRDTKSKPTRMKTVMPVLTGEGTSAQGKQCSFILYGLENGARAGGTAHATSVYMWPPESVVRDTNGRSILPDVLGVRFLELG
jgi:hypothetical protein